MIKGNSVYLRPIVKDDLPILNEWKNDEETFRNLGGGFSPTSIDQQEKWIDNLIDMTGNNRRFIICNCENTSVGFIGLYDIQWVHRTCEIGLYIGNKSVKGKGFGKEACQLIEGFAKRYLNLRKIKLSVVSDNSVAIRLWNTLGYEKIGQYERDRYIDGEYKDVIIMEKFI